ncbi:hypothetical protein EV356DRAFT_528518 [Viridothelium virens]|uniref:50S ribosomal protein YmL27 n=1 Tax=Viridothelium virens TaxID=1048519 RepID=A0A6A6HNX2_VIRVR|nr:hypothetical protein EV356DRAFT_528518 [Viridothelium virens]
MFKPTAPLYRRLRRLALTTKQAGKGYYKGTGSGSMGRHTKHGGYIVEYEKVRTYVVPDLDGFMLKPFVASRIERRRGEFPQGEEFKGDLLGPLSGRRYLSQWKSENGVE